MKGIIYVLTALSIENALTTQCYKHDLVEELSAWRTCFRTKRTEQRTNVKYTAIIQHQLNYAAIVIVRGKYLNQCSDGTY